jgi:hypothetical protein
LITRRRLYRCRATGRSGAEDGVEVDDGDGVDELGVLTGIVRIVSPLISITSKVSIELMLNLIENYLLI